MHFDFTISLGNVLTAVGMFAGFWIAHQQNIRRLENIYCKLDLVYKWFEKRVLDSTEVIQR